jgi:hypothetical protein
VVDRRCPTPDEIRSELAELLTLADTLRGRAVMMAAWPITETTVHTGPDGPTIVLTPAGWTAEDVEAFMAMGRDLVDHALVVGTRLAALERLAAAPRRPARRPAPGGVVQAAPRLGPGPLPLPGPPAGPEPDGGAPPAA